MKAIFCIIYLIVLPFILGRIPVPPSKEGRPFLQVKRFVFGFILLLSSAFIPGLIAVFSDWTLTSFLKLWSAVLIVLLLLSLILYARDLIQKLSGTVEKDAGASIYEADRHGSGRKKRTAALEILCVVAVLLHAFVVFYFMHIDDDDIVYVGAATTAVDTNTVFRYNPQSGLPVLHMNENTLDRIAVAPLHAPVAAISRVSGVRPAVLCHTVLPPVLTLAFFGILYLTGGLLFRRDREKAALFTLFAWLCTICSGFSVYTSGTFLTARSWQGKGILCGLIIPAALYEFIRLYRQKDQFHSDDVIGLLAVSTAGACATSMGAALLCVMAAVWALLLLIRFHRSKSFLITIICLLPAAFGAALYVAVHHRFIGM